MKMSKEFIVSVKKSTVLRAAVIVSALTLGSMGVMEGYTRYQDQQEPETFRVGDRWRIKGPGYTIDQSQIDPTIVRVIRDSLWLDRSPFKRGVNKLDQLCGQSLTIYEDSERALYVRQPLADTCLAK